MIELKDEEKYGFCITFIRSTASTLSFFVLGHFYCFHSYHPQHVNLCTNYLNIYSLSQSFKELHLFIFR